MWIGWIEFDVLLGDVHSLKEKRSVVRPLLAELKRRFDVSVAEVGDHDQYRRTVSWASAWSQRTGHTSSRCLPPSNASWRPGPNSNCSAPGSANSAATTEPANAPQTPVDCSVSALLRPHNGSYGAVGWDVVDNFCGVGAVLVS